MIGLCEISGRIFPILWFRFAYVHLFNNKLLGRSKTVNLDMYKTENRKTRSLYLPRMKVVSCAAKRLHNPSVLSS